MASAAPLSDGRRVGSGFRDALWSDAPTLELLDSRTGEEPTYHVKFDAEELFGSDTDGGSVVVDLFEGYLEPAA